jgi:hypothetical protein
MEEGRESPVQLPAVWTIIVSGGMSIGGLSFSIDIPTCDVIKQILVSDSIRVVSFSLRKKGISCAWMRTPVCTVWISGMSSRTLCMKGWKLCL